MEFKGSSRGQMLGNKDGVVSQQIFAAVNIPRDQCSRSVSQQIVNKRMETWEWEWKKKLVFFFL